MSITTHEIAYFVLIVLFLYILSLVKVTFARITEANKPASDEPILTKSAYQNQLEVLLDTELTPEQVAAIYHYSLLRFRSVHEKVYHIVPNTED